MMMGVVDVNLHVVAQASLLTHLMALILITTGVALRVVAQACPLTRKTCILVAVGVNRCVVVQAHLTVLILITMGVDLHIVARACLLTQILMAVGVNRRVVLVQAHLTALILITTGVDLGVVVAQAWTRILTAVGINQHIVVQAHLTALVLITTGVDLVRIVAQACLLTQILVAIGVNQRVVAQAHLMMAMGTNQHVEAQARPISHVHGAAYINHPLTAPEPLSAHCHDNSEVIIPRTSGPLPHFVTERSQERIPKQPTMKKVSRRCFSMPCMNSRALFLRQTHFQMTRYKSSGPGPFGRTPVKE